MTSYIPPDNSCNAREILDRVGDKWSVLAIVNLGGGSMRFSELLRAGHGVSQRMLTQTLRQLERDGIVWRKVTPTVPWSGTHMSAIAKARAEYDAREKAKTESTAAR